ncbi:MAG: LytR/AlgR family response regulator transcription factor, partial [bacterium]
MTGSIRTILVDDEDLPREMLKEYLADYGGIKVIAECSNGKDAVHAIHAHDPDLIFLDVQMPELSGFDVLK